jgi:leader peptidase (prepilin peptidase)/N-methyltransferase
MVFLLSGIFAYITVRQTDRLLDGEAGYAGNPVFMYGIVAFMAVCGELLYHRIAGSAVSRYAVFQLMLTYFFVSAAAIYDCKLKKIPNGIPAGLLAAGISVLAFETVRAHTYGFVLSGALGGLFMIALLYAASKITKGGIGYGDIKLLGAMGFCIGIYAVLSVLLLSLSLCSLFLLVLVLMKKKKLSGDMPFAPFIYAGYVIALALFLY